MFTNLSELSRLAEPGGREITWLGGIAGVLVLIVFLAVLVLVIAAIVSTLMDADTSGGGKLLWVVLILWFPLFGAIAWFVVGKKGHLNRLLGIDKGKARHTIPASVGQHSNVAPPDQTGLGNA